MLFVAQQLEKTIVVAKTRLQAMTEEAASAKPYADKWSIKEILGHLIDSAANNHQRIVRMQEKPDIGTLVYSQLHWVESQQYQNEPWVDVVEFWYRYNMHLVHIIANVNAGLLHNTCDMGYAEPAPLRFVIEDYLRHVHHHLDQIFSDADPRHRKQWVQQNPLDMSSL